MIDKKTPTPRVRDGKPVWTEEIFDYTVAAVSNRYAVTSTEFFRTQLTASTLEPRTLQKPTAHSAGAGVKILSASMHADTKRAYQLLIGGRKSSV